jgi:HNH endonuclease
VTVEALTAHEPSFRVRTPDILRDTPQGGQCPTPPRPNVDRLLENIGAPTHDGCWPWLGSVSGTGYGSFSIRLARGQRSGRVAHRLVYEVLVGPVPPELELDHLCRNRRCVNPAHLEPVTASENQIRAKRKSRCKHGHSMTGENVVWIAGRGGRLCRRCRACHRQGVRDSRARQRRAGK